MNKYFILGQQGTCLHFIACLIRLLYDKNYYDICKSTNQLGMYDSIFGAHAFYETVIEQQRLSQYPEETWSIIALNLLKKTFAGEISLQRPYWIDYNIIPVHYGNQKTIDYILNSVENSKIVFIKFDNNDILQIGLNFINKVYLDSLLNPIYGGVTRLLRLYRKFPDAIIFDRQQFLNINQEELIEFAKKVVELELYDEKFMKNPDTHENVKVINFGEIYNLDSLLNSLAEFSGQTITDKLRKFADNFLYNQPTLESSINFIKQIKDNPHSDFMYNDLMCNFNKLTNDEAVAKWKEYDSKQ